MVTSQQVLELEKPKVDDKKYLFLHGILGEADENNIVTTFESNGQYHSLILDKNLRGEIPLKEILSSNLLNKESKNNCVLASFKSTDIKEVENWFKFISSTYN